MAPSICVVDVDAHLDPDEVKRVAAALNRQVIEHVAPEWGVLASVRAGTESYPSEWRLELRNQSTETGEYGHHDETATGMPLMIVLVDVCLQGGVSWSSVASHEIIEALVDPYLRRCVQDESTGAVYAAEACDACETLSYDIDGVEVSDFCTPAWFEPPRDLTGVKFDYLGKCPEPFSVLPGGYSQTWDGNGWTQHGSQRSYRKTLADLGLSRGVRRRALGKV